MGDAEIGIDRLGEGRQARMRISGGWGIWRSSFLLFVETNFVEKSHSLILNRVGINTRLRYRRQASIHNECDSKPEEAEMR
jgi:hypothetical protein